MACAIGKTQHRTRWLEPGERTAAQRTGGTVWSGSLPAVVEAVYEEEVNELFMPFAIEVEVGPVWRRIEMQ